uniref:RIN4 pathogenic type III effector avirulence factor Avr cleavage site domain-containing protein n=1 Tax=Manihot esculenta TaxID=3983 RepID=A0A2C9UYY7_MANES
MASSHSQQQPAHVPKFGNWDNDDIPYTAFFDNARKEKASVPINPNDPEQNLEAFTYGNGRVDLSCGHSQKSISSESGSSLLQATGYRREKSQRKKSWAPEGVGNNNSFSTSVALAPQHSRQKSGSHPPGDDRVSAVAFYFLVLILLDSWIKALHSIFDSLIWVVESAS